MESAIKLRLPATSANLGAAFDTAAVALDFHLHIQAVGAEKFSITASGVNSDQCAALENNLLLKTYTDILRREGVAPPPLAVRMHNEIPLGMGCGSSAAVQLAAIALATHFGQLGFSEDRILSEACELEGHPDNAAACWLGGFVTSAQLNGALHFAKVEPPVEWRAMLVSPNNPVATSRARAILPAHYSRADTVANIQAAALLTLAFSQGRGDLLKPAMTDRIHQPYRTEICPLLPKLLPLAGRGGILGVALSGAGPSVLLILANEQSRAEAERVVFQAVEPLHEVVVRTVAFEHCGGRTYLTDRQFIGATEAPSSR